MQILCQQIMLPSLIQGKNLEMLSVVYLQFLVKYGTKQIIPNQYTCIWGENKILCCIKQLPKKKV